MLQNDPALRPPMGEVVSHFREIMGKLGPYKLRSRMVRDNEIGLAIWWRAAKQWCRTVGYFIGGKAAIPEPS
jgi:hypothetical protein